MQPRTRVSLRQYSTMRLGGDAAYAVDVHDRADLTAAVRWADERQLPILMIGLGSNIIWRDDGFQGLLLINAMRRYEVIEEDGDNVYLTVGAGEVWDDIVKRTVEAGLTGIEALSLIPGTAGATPVQNVGAYGQEIANTLVSVEAYDRTTDSFLNIPTADCGFGYRTSRFKAADRGRFFITAITLHLMRANPTPPFHAGLQSYLDEHHVTEYTPSTIRNAVVAIRSQKLPDPAKVANNGSFFANPLVDEGKFAQLQSAFPDMPHWPTDEGMVKLSAAWLIEQAGFKDYHDEATGMATWPTQPLVFINEHAKTTADLLAFKQKITSAVSKQFGIALVQEPELLP